MKEQRKKGGFAGLLSMSEYNPIILVYPDFLYYFLFNFIIVFFFLFGFSTEYPTFQETFQSYANEKMLTLITSHEKTSQKLEKRNIKTHVEVKSGRYV